MALLKSKYIPLGKKIPEFSLKDSFQKSFDSRDLFGEQGLLVVFTCNHCPYALAVWPRLIKLASHAKKHKIQSVAINPNIHPDYPEDSPANMKKKIKEWGLDFPYLVDETQNTAHDFEAQCTPDFYLFDQNRRLVYHGRLDDNWQEEKKVTRDELKEAIDNLASGLKIAQDQKPSMGCSIKWQT